MGTIYGFMDSQKEFSRSSFRRGGTVPIITGYMPCLRFDRGRDKVPRLSSQTTLVLECILKVLDVRLPLQGDIGKPDIVEANTESTKRILRPTF
jgi:hypothetical protein